MATKALLALGRAGDFPQYDGANIFGSRCLRHCVHASSRPLWQRVRIDYMRCGVSEAFDLGLHRDQGRLVDKGGFLRQVLGEVSGGVRCARREQGLKHHLSEVASQRHVRHVQERHAHHHLGSHGSCQPAEEQAVVHDHRACPVVVQLAEQGRPQLLRRLRLLGRPGDRARHRSPNRGVSLCDLSRAIRGTRVDHPHGQPRRPELEGARPEGASLFYFAVAVAHRVCLCPCGHCLFSRHRWWASVALVAPVGPSGGRFGILIACAWQDRKELRSMDCAESDGVVPSHAIVVPSRISPLRPSVGVSGVAFVWASPSTSRPLQSPIQHQWHSLRCWCTRGSAQLPSLKACIIRLGPRLGACLSPSWFAEAVSASILSMVLAYALACVRGAGRSVANRWDVHCIRLYHPGALQVLAAV